MESFSTEERQSISDIFSRLLGDMADEQSLRQTMETSSGFDTDLWAKMAELGLTGIMIGVDHNGVGGSIMEAEALMEQAGEHLYSGPFISTCVIAPTLLSACDDTALASKHLNGIADGSTIFAIAGCGESGDWSLPPEVEAKKNNDAWQLTGNAGFVSHVAIASHCLVYAKTDTGTGVFLVDTQDENIKVTAHQANDPTLRLASLTFGQVNAQRLTGIGNDTIDLALRHSLAALAGEQVGAARKIFNITIEYLKTRHQFGQPIGRFQALKHIAADLLIELESASSAAIHAARSIATDSEDQQLMACLAGFTCADSFRKIAADAIQLHGGIAYTMEHVSHLYWRRAQTGQWLYCSSDSLRNMYLSEMEKTL